MAAREQEEENNSPPTSSTSPTPSLASSTDPSSPKGKNKLLFKSNLQVLLKKQDDELIKSLEYKKKLEEEKKHNDGTTEEEGDAKGSKLGTDTDGKGKGGRGESKTTDNTSSRENQDGDDEVFEASSPAVSKNKAKEDSPKALHNANDEKEAKELKKENKKERESVESKKKEKSPACKKKDTEDDEGYIESTKPSKSPREEKKLESGNKKSTKENEKLKIDERKSRANESEDDVEEPEEKKRNEGGKENEESTKKADDGGEVKEKGKEERISPAEVAKTSGSITPHASPTSPKVTKDEGNDSLKKKEKHQGTMMKKGSSPFSRSKKYYFVLDGKRLMYYRSEADYKGKIGAKGSLDLKMLEEVRIKKPGRMKSKFPFCIKGRNLKSITLATDTEEQREKWMAILRGTMEQKTRLSGSENVLNSSESPVAEAKKEKYATLPATKGSTKSEETSSDSEEENKVEDKVEVEEEPKLIQPKKIGLVGPGIKLDLSNIKLKKIEEKKKLQDDEANDQNSEIFKVKLRKPEVKGVPVAVNKDEQQEAGKGKELVSKKPSKQPNIPLNKSPLLAHAEVEADKMLSTNSNKNTVERKRSPSPNIPISKNVHTFLSKSTEDEEDESTTKADAPARKDVEVHVAKSKEIRYSESLLSIEDSNFIEYLQDEEKLDDSKDEVEENEVNNKDKSNNNASEDNDEILQVSVTVKDTSEGEPEYEELDEEFLQKMKDNKAAELTNRGSGRFSSGNPSVETSENNIDSDADASESSGEEVISETVGSSKSKNGDNELENSSTNKLQSCKNNLSDISKNEENGQGESSTSCLEKCNLSPKTETDVLNQGNLVRVRTSTNESSTSSSREDSEDTDKKVRKFKRFSLKQSGNSEQDKQEEETRDANGKRKKKSSFSKFLPTKSKEKKKLKEDRRDVTSPQSEVVSSVSVSNECDTRHQEESSLQKSEGEVTGDNQERSKMIIPEISLQVETSDKEMPCKVELRTNYQSVKQESRGSTYSRSSMISVEADPPPSVPEKKGIRSTSPGHDVPQNNRPVTMLTSEMSQADSDVDDDMKVDGMLTEDQIHAILSGKGNCDKKVSSSFQNSGNSLLSRDYAQSGPDKYDQISRRGSKISTISTESDEPLPKTDFLSCDRNSVSSGSLKSKDKCEDSDASNDIEVNESKDSADSFDPDVAVLRKSRLTDSRSCGPRVSLTLPEFTVMEEEGPGSPDYKSTSHDTASDIADGNEQDEKCDYFPVIGGGDIEIRNPSSLRLDSDFSGTGIRTSGINSLKAFLEENQEEEVSPTRSGISRLGHSPAVERLKRESSEDSQEIISNK